MKQSRKLKIQPKLVERTYSRTIVPEILLKGKWLEEAGFKSGQNVEVRQEKNKLVITLVY